MTYEAPNIFYLRDFGPEVKRIKYVFHLRTNIQDEGIVPTGLPQTQQSEFNYSIRRAQEVLTVGVNKDPEQLEKQRPGITDTGIERTEPSGLLYCRGGIQVLQDLIKKNWKITNAFFTKVTTQQRLATGHGLPQKIKITIEISENNGSELKLEEITQKHIKRLMNLVWNYCHVWYNAHYKEIVLSFIGKWSYESPPLSDIHLPELSSA